MGSTHPTLVGLATLSALALFVSACASPPSSGAVRAEPPQRALATPKPIAASPPSDPADDAADESRADAGSSARDAASADASAADSTSDRAASAHASCPGEMTLVAGEACTAVREECVEWVEPPNIARDGRCAKYASPSSCVGSHVAVRFCIDRDEYTSESDPRPVTTISWTDAKRVCEKAGKRLCKESEWNFACEGESMLPYPTGFERPSTQCNFDQHKLTDRSGHIIDFRRPSSELTECTSPFGVRNMVGNVDEWTERDVTGGPNHTALKGGWWLAGRNRCRPATTAHDEHYRDFQTGFRCCSDAKND